ncbi:MAG: hypothetical protein UW52_C0032G0003 [Candidatus Gottesmanbacteria bacterium GW2011_GWA1_44_24b]|nr:MAG: hypothetical protein UW52_C0032G0003 [Candidatus Gottesmanbacteria bacterium GW2011_GWA1_44_24b]
MKKTVRRRQPKHARPYKPRQTKQHVFSRRYLFVIVGLVIVGVILWKLPIISSPRKQYQYGITSDGLTNTTLNASASGAFEKQTLIEHVTSQIREEKEIIYGDEFSQWAVLENFKDGYRLIYPYGFNITYDSNKIEVVPPSGGGSVTVSITGKLFNLVINSAEVNEKQLNLLQAAERLIKESFEFVSTPDALETEKNDKRFTH